jgi:two-component system, NtrC family, sensor histidine kinase PilS
VAVRDPTRLLGPLALARLGLASALFAVGPYIAADVIARDARLVVLLGAAASGAVLLLAPLVAAQRSGAAAHRPGAAAHRSGAAAQRIRALLCLLDVALITAVVNLTGGPRSLFTFLYVPSVTAAAVLLSRAGALAIAAVASTLYVGLVMARTVFPLTMFFEPLGATTTLELLTMFLNSATLVIVAIVAGGLAEQFRSTHQALEQQTRTLRDVQAFKDLVFQSVGSGLIALDHDHVITAFNHAAEQITGRPALVALGARWSGLFGASLGLDAVDAAIARGESSRHEITLDRPDGSAIPVRITFSPLHAGDGTRVGLMATCEDLSAIRAMEERMRQADRLATLGRMSANIAHEIRNPLASLSGAIEALTSTDTPEQARARLADIVLHEFERLDTIIRNFLEYARPAPLTLAPVDVTEMVEDVLALVDHRGHPDGLKIVRDLPAVLPWHLDPQQFRQALWNLCLNALEALPDGGELRVGACVQADRLSLSVSDTGAGIAPEDVQHVFEPFFSTKPQGSGLGLALVHRIAQAHGGTVDVRSRAGTGTVFTVSLPRAHA